MSSDKISVYIDSDLKELIPIFLENRKQDVSYLRQAYADRDTARLKIIAHNMKGTGGGYGFDDISKIGAQIEDTIVTGELEPILTLIDQLENYLDRVDVLFK